MKKFIYYIGFLALCLLPASCSLEEESSTEVEKDKYMNDAKEAQDVLLGVWLQWTKSVNWQKNTMPS